MKQIKLVLAALTAVLAIGMVGAGHAGAHGANHGQFDLYTAAGPTATPCEFTFNKTNWTPATAPLWTSSTDITGVTKDPANCAALDSITTSGLVLTKSGGGSYGLSGPLTIVVKTIFGRFTCHYDLPYISGNWATQSGPPAWEEFTLPTGTMGIKMPGSGGLCTDPLTGTGGFLHTDQL